MKRIGLLSLLLLAVLALSACSAGASAGGKGGSGSQSVTIKGTEFAFEPKQVTVKAGQPVRLVFQNAGKKDHELIVENLKAQGLQVDLGKAGSIPSDEKGEVENDAKAGTVHAYAAPGGQAVVTFTPAEAGTYQFLCDLPGHHEAGMEGSMVVQ